MSDPVALPLARQLAFDELDTPLYDTTFVVVDLETTGTSPDGDAITEIGAVKVRGGEVLGEFATLVNPGFAIPPGIVQITGITTAMVYAAPRIEAVLPGFLEFAAGAVLVAHNARFDTAFLKAAAARQGIDWPNPRVLCTVKLARRVLSRDEAPSARLGVLAAVLGASTTPTHRALDDARATVDVLHALIARVGNQGVHSLTELLDYLPAVTGTQRAKRTFATDLPAAPGVYLFRGPSDEVLYIGTAVNLRRRVRTYFTGSETRGRMKEMVALAIRVDHVVCAHGLEAGVRELRLLAAHAPPYNRRSKFPRKGWWLTLSDEPFPRLVTVRTPTRTALGPFASRADAVDVGATVAEFAGLRTCTTRLARTARHTCPPAAVGGCPAARADGLDAAGHAPAVRAVRDLFTGRADTLLRAMLDRIETHSADQHFEAAARLRDRTAAVVTALHRTQRLTALARIPELIVALPDGAKGWEFAVIRHGRLAAAGTAPRGTPPMAVVDQLVAAAETVVPDLGDAARSGPRPPATSKPTTAPAGTATASAGTATTSAGTATAPAGTATASAGAAVAMDGTAVAAPVTVAGAPATTASGSATTATASAGTATASAGAAVDSAGTATGSAGAAVAMDGTAAPVTVAGAPATMASGSATTASGSAKAVGPPGSVGATFGGDGVAAPPAGAGGLVVAVGVAVSDGHAVEVDAGALFGRVLSEDDIPPLRGASPEEVGVVARWLATPGARIVRTSEGYREPLYGAARWAGWAKLARTAATAVSAADEYLAQR